MTSARVRFTFPPEKVNQPVIYTMGKQFGVVTNIQRANIGRERGWMIIEIEGAEDAVQQALSWAQQEGVQVDPIGPDEA
jgi:ABC-type methionine transport system ATPase subunit